MIKVVVYFTFEWIQNTSNTPLPICISIISCSWNTSSYLPYAINIMHVEFLVTQGARPSPATWLVLFFMMTSSNGNIFRPTGPLCGEFTGPDEFPLQRPVTQSLDVFFDLCLNKRLSKQSWGWLFETPSRSLWRHYNVPEYFSPNWIRIKI